MEMQRNCNYIRDLLLVKKIIDYNNGFIHTMMMHCADIEVFKTLYQRNDLQDYNTFLKLLKLIIKKDNIFALFAFSESLNIILKENTQLLKKWIIKYNSNNSKFFMRFYLNMEIQ
ncbi:hypothetical protein ACTFIV_011144 [Dictyostelium citrinum]